MESTIVATPRAHRINAWLLYAAARPIVLVDGHKHPARWGKPTSIPVEPGTHAVAVGIMYRGTHWLLGTDGRSFDVAEGQTLTVEARNGALNSDPFVVTAVRPRL